MKVDAVVLANGEYPAAAPPLQILADAPYVICCDGARTNISGTDISPILL